ncbi:class III lanthionine synthetase LanKC [Clavibacter michiganensis]|nr:class III lanthionine synthetase LanKC [Clavibacter michiganensis]
MDDLEPYCQAHPHYFAPIEERVDGSARFSTAVPHEWREQRGFEWTSVMRPGSPMPTQGWKIHVSTTLDEADEALRIVAVICVRLDIAFKHLSTRSRLYSRNSKVYPREHAGKFITCYPPENRLEELLGDLEEGLRGFHGPYILSDKKWREAPVFLRYGVFRPYLPTGSDELTATLLAAGDEEYEADERNAYFHVPAWVTPPALLSAWIDDPGDAGAVHDLPFAITSAIQFSNAGGTYRGRVTTTDEPVVVKEARPFGGLDFEFRTATARLEHEHRVLLDLAALDSVSDVVWFGKAWEHDFLASTEHQAVPLNRWVTRRYPLYEDSGTQVLAYLRSATGLLVRLIDAVQEVHAHGWTHQDLHPGNVLVRDDDEDDQPPVFLIDWEGALPADGPATHQTLAAPGFRTKRRMHPVEIDWHGVRQIASYLVTPILIQTELVPDYTHQVRALAADRFRSHPEARAQLERFETLIADLDARVARTGPDDDDEAAGSGPSSRLRLRTPSRSTPGAVAFQEQVLEGIGSLEEDWPYAFRRHPVHVHGLDAYSSGLAYGDDGIDAVVAEARGPATGRRGTDVVIQTEDAELSTSLEVGGRSGLWCGRMGGLFRIALDGDGNRLRRVVDRGLPLWLSGGSGSRVFDQLPGTLLGLLRIADPMRLGDDGRAQGAIISRLGDVAESYLADPERTAPLTSDRPAAGNAPVEQDSGLLYGHLGMAWLFSEAWSQTGDPKWLDRCGTALLHELTGYVLDDATGTMQLTQGQRELPYLSMGSAGFGVVLSELDSSQVPDAVSSAAPLLLAATEAPLSVYPGLFSGYAGLALGNLGLRRFLGRPPRPVEEAVTTLSAFSIQTDAGLVFAGDSGLRLTSDVATGGAGISLALRRLSQGLCDPLPMTRLPRT